MPFLQRLYHRLPLWIAFFFFFSLPLVFKQTENSQNRCILSKREKKLERHPSDLHLVRQVLYPDTQERDGITEFSMLSLQAKNRPEFYSPSVQGEGFFCVTVTI